MNRRTAQTTLRGRFGQQEDSIPKLIGAREKSEVNGPSLASVVILLGLHFITALLMKQSPLFTTFHAYLTLAAGFYCLLRVKSHPEQLVYALAYIGGVELLWRGNNAAIFYEIGKYSLIALSILGILLSGRLGAIKKWPLLYVILLVPSLFVLPNFNRQYVAFNLAGPVATGLICLFLGMYSFSLSQFKRFLLAVLIPSVSLGFLSIFFTVVSENIVFTGASLRATSAEIGPNQVSSILGLASICAFAYALLEKQNKPLRLLMLGIFFWMLAQSMLTFSRGGLWSAVGAVVVGAIFLSRDRRTRAGVFASAVLLIPIFIYLVFPAIDRFTGNTLSARLQDVDTTNRDLIMRVDLQLFQENPVFGVGPGQSEILHSRYFAWANTHTEYTRLLAEHGSFGVAVLLILLTVTLQRVFSKRPVYARSFGVMFTVWALLFMAHSATRLVAVSLIFALPEMTLDIDEAEKTEEVKARPPIQAGRPLRPERP